MNDTPLLPAWVVLPVATVMLLVVAVHLMLLLRSAMPASRRRIRTINGWLMLFLVPIAAAAFGIVTPANPTRFVFVWLVVIAMLVLLIALAMLDMLNTSRLYRREQDELADQFRRSRHESEKRER